ncbi:30S ribosomal protein S4 [Candidatus Woesearchaeota archaeon]|nr:30S ribosomal protein S4 [Candidatus Woesearchaeota archaeon]
MGDIKKQKKKYSKPSHPWQKDRIDEEKEMLKHYGLRRKNEIWRMDSLLRKFLNRAKTIIAQRNTQSEFEKKQMLDRLYSLGLLKQGSRVEDVLNLTLKNLMERRLQTLIARKQLARTMLQARQFITHEYVAIGAKKITAPSYLVSVKEEALIRLVKPINIDGVAEEKNEKEVKPDGV